MNTTFENISISEATIVNEIIQHVNKEGSHKSNWYVGIASIPRDRLFNDHNVQENSWWIFRSAGNDFSARRIEKHLINTYGFDGGSGGGDSSTIFVYAYRKTHSTNP